MADITLKDNEEIILEQRHRKEKKELQAHIQSLKKTAKNDKSKKKELTAEIAKLEIDLEARHKKEIENIQNGCNHVTEEEDEIINNKVQEKDNTKLKISKAQKRRDKKLQHERVREEEIRLQEQENFYGPRNIENQAMTLKLNEKKLRIYSIPSDGDCLYGAVAHQLETKYNKSISVETLRNNVALHIKACKEEFMPFMCNPNTGLNFTDEEFNEYCDKIRNTKVWGGDLEIRALSNYLKCPISVIQASGPTAIEHGVEFSGFPLIITYHRHMYSLGEHYNSTQDLIEVGE